MQNTQTAPTKEELLGGFKMIAALGEAIQELGEVPSGHLYAQVMAHFSLQSYEKAIDILVKAKMVEKDRSHLLRWVGPAKKVQA